MLHHRSGNLCILTVCYLDKNEEFKYTEFISFEFLCCLAAPVLSIRILISGIIQDICLHDERTVILHGEMRLLKYNYIPIPGKVMVS